jgi:hypothetical protein
VPPPGRPHFGSPRQRVLGICEKRRFVQTKLKKRIFKIPSEKKHFPLLRDPLFSVNIMEAFLCFLKFAFFWEKVKNVSKSNKNKEILTRSKDFSPVFESKTIAFCKQYNEIL